MAGIHRRFYTEIGDLSLSCGKHEVIFRRGYKPKRVLVHMNNEEGLPICHAELNSLAVTITDNGFILNADIKSDKAYIMWITTEVDEEI